MKKLYLFIILLLFAVQIKAQSVQDANNSTTGSLAADTLSANEVFPGAWRLITGYNSVSVSMYSNISSAASGLKIYFATKMLNNTYKIIDSTAQTYTTGTSLNLTVPVTAPYLKVQYTNGATVQTYFYLITMLHAGTQGNTSITVTGGASAANQTLQLNKTDSLQYRKQMTPVRDSMVNTQVKTYDFGMATKAQFSIYNPSATLIDSIKISAWNYAKNAYTTNGFAIEGLNYNDNGYTEVSNILVLIPVSTTRKFTIAGYGHGLIKIEWVSTADKTAGQKFYISYQKIN